MKEKVQTKVACSNKSLRRMLNQEPIRKSRGSAPGRPRKTPEPKESGESSRLCSEVSEKDGTAPRCSLRQHPLSVHLLCLLFARLIVKCDKIEGIWRTLFPSQFKGNKTEGKGKLSDLLGLAKLFMA